MSVQVCREEEEEERILSSPRRARQREAPLLRPEPKRTHLDGLVVGNLLVQLLLVGGRHLGVDAHVRLRWSRVSFKAQRRQASVRAKRVWRAPPGATPACASHAPLPLGLARTRASGERVRGAGDRERRGDARTGEHQRESRECVCVCSTWERVCLLVVLGFYAL